MGRGTSGGTWRSSEDAHDDVRLSEALEAGLSTSRDSGGSCLVAGSGGASQRGGLWGSAGPGGRGWTGGAAGTWQLESSTLVALGSFEYTSGSPGASESWSASWRAGERERPREGHHIPGGSSQLCGPRRAAPVLNPPDLVTRPLPLGLSGPGGFSLLQGFSPRQPGPG